MAPEPPPSAHLRPESREVIELRRLRDASPHLAQAVDLQLAVLDAQRLMQSRVPLPTIVGRDDLLGARQAAGQRLIEFDDIAFDSSDVRRLLRDAADLLRRFDLIDAADAGRANELVRDAAALPVALRAWYDAPIRDDAAAALTPGLSQVCLVAMRPYLDRCAAAVQAAVKRATDPRPSCPVCAGEPDFTIWSAAGRLLVCSRCAGRWAFPEGACGFCGEIAPAARKTFASGSRTYRVEACVTCRRYLKGFDERVSARPAILTVDTIATLPLDAAAMQLGFE